MSAVALTTPRESDVAIAAALASLPVPLRDAAIEAIICEAGSHGFSGFGGRCGLAAVAINRVLFGGSRKLVAAVNAMFYRKGDQWVGHVAVLDRRGVYWDADGEPKPYDVIDSWGMLDVEDSEYRDRALAFGGSWDDEAADTVLRRVVTERAVLDVFTDHHLLSEMQELLRASAQHVLDL
jgi:hypothetical protein